MGARPGSGGEEGAGEVLQGLVEHVTFRDEATGYTVLKISPEKGYGDDAGGDLFARRRVTAVGRSPEAGAGVRVRLLGVWGRHPTHGRQFEFEVLQPLDPLDAEGLERYLASKTFPGIGAALAGRIVARLGVEALDRIRADRSSLDGIRGLRAEVAERLYDTVVAQAALHRAHAFLHGVGLGPVSAQMVVSELGPECEALVREDPYRLAGVPGLGFRSADRVALALGLSEDDPRRLGAALAHGLDLAADDGHSFLPLGELVERARGLLRSDSPSDAFVGALEPRARTGELVVDRAQLEEGSAGEPAPPADDARVYLPWLYTSESGLAENLARLITAGRSAPLADERALETAERSALLELHADQRDAVLTLLAHPVAVLTGGPGVGKTTIVRLVADLAQAAGASVRLASPTGRAAKRLAEATGRPASTVHRMLGYNPGDGRFEHGRRQPLRAGLVIVDEISMLDVVLAHHLLKAIESPTRLLLVGDPDQLPSVGPGNVLADLLRSGRVPVARLTRIYRQGADSLIVANAHRILAGELPRVPERGDRQADFYFFPSEEPAAIADLVLDVVTRRIPETFGFEWTVDVQVIVPMYRGECGVDTLNDRLREAAGYGGHEVERAGRLWRVGDRVIHTRNDYEKEVFNGDMGRITGVSPDGIVTVRYPEQDVTYVGAELSDLRPAFAITVHRSQGGEFPVVVIPLVSQHAVMLQRNLLYTAVTRARRLVVLVGSRRALAIAVENARQAWRESALAERLERAVEQEQSR